MPQVRKVNDPVNFQEPGPIRFDIFAGVPNVTVMNRTGYGKA